MGYALSVAGTTTAKLFVKKLNDSNYSHEVLGQWDGSNEFFFNIATGDQNVQVVDDILLLNANDEIYLETSLFSIGTLTIYKDETNVELFLAPVVGEGGTINLSPNNNIMPTDKQVDFISAICSRYNLIIEKGDSITNELNIEPAQDYFNTGVSKDWSSKIDMNKDRIIKPTNEFRKERINMSDLEDDDKTNEYWQNTFGNAYNSYKTDLDGDFGDGDLRI